MIVFFGYGNLFRGSKYPILKDPGAKNHTWYGFGAWTL